MKRFSFSPIARFFTFRRELGLLWRAFMTPATPLYLKGLMLLVPLYLVSPIDLIPDVVPFAGWLDDVVIVPFMVSWIVRLLPQPVPVRTRSTGRDLTIDGTARRL